MSVLYSDIMEVDVEYELIHCNVTFTVGMPKLPCCRFYNKIRLSIFSF